jgi:hypothetical protein
VVQTDGRWSASLEDTLANHVEVAEGEGRSLAEALWNLTDQHLHSAKGSTGDVSIIPARIMLVASILWVDATRKAAQVDAEKAAALALEARKTAVSHAQAAAARDELFDRTMIEAW